MPTLHPLFTDHAVIASQRPRVMGGSAPDSQVTVTLAGATTHATAGTDGRWQAEFPPLPAGGPHVLVARDAAGEVSALDILLGEVWLGSGQSNMEYTLGQTKDTEDDLAAADDSVVVHSASVPTPVAVRYAWQANPETTLENAAGLPASPFRTDG